MSEPETFYEFEESALARRKEEAALSVKEVAELLGVHRNSVGKMLESGRLVGFRIGLNGRGWRIQPSELDAFRRRGGTRVRGSGK